MLTKEAVFRQIDADRVEPIQQLVAVDYDNTIQMPVSFRYRDHHYEVTELIGSFRESSHDPSVLYLVRARQGVYALYQDLIELESPFLWRGQWVLHFKVEEEKETAMLVDVKLKRAANFHGHLCPDLVIGHRAGQTALARLTLELMYWSNLRVIVENTTSAVDAVQQLIGCTLGNRRLLLYDYGKHVYTFVYGKGEGLRLSLRPEALPESSQFLALEERIQTERATMLEMARYQALLDERIAALLAVPADMLFSAQRTAVEWPEGPLTSALVLCDGCGEPVVKTHLVLRDGRHLCRSCGDGDDSEKYVVPPIVRWDES
jgi:formylmethanofuran dehydrogenase subunit E